MALAALQTSTCVHRDRRLSRGGLQTLPRASAGSLSQSRGEEACTSRSPEEEAADHFEHILSALSDSEDVMEALSLRSFYSVTGHPLLEKFPQQKVAVCGDCVGSGSDLW